jgi:homocitrate synthase NifV
MESNHKIFVIDRTLPEIRSSLLKMSRLDILDLCWMLMNAGADFIETDRELLNKMGKLPEGLSFQLQTNSLSDLEACARFKIKRCVLHKAFFDSPGAAETIRKEGLYTVLEINAENLADLQYMERLKNGRNHDTLSCLRVSGLGRLDSSGWLEPVLRLRNVLGKEIDIFPDDRFSMGNAIALEAAMGGLDYITATFMGYGNGGGHAALEAVLSALMLYKPGLKKVNPDVLSVLRDQFAKCSHTKIPRNCPIVGENTLNRREKRYSANFTAFRELIDA